jgi:uncharacterized 2Fe-2S/4Fe-4S cluster protein (DUF4445 family)
MRKIQHAGNRMPAEKHKVNSKVHRIDFEPMGLSTMVPAGTAITDAADHMDIPMRTDCGGKGLCAKCRVIASPASSLSPLTESELDVFSPSEIKQSYRLGCQALIIDDLTVTLPKQAIDTGEAIEKGISQKSYSCDPMVRRIPLPTATLPTHLAGADLIGLILARIKKATGRQLRFEDIAALRQLSEVGTEGQALTIVYRKSRGVTAVIAGNSPRSLGVAIDAGTTTLAAYLCDFATGHVLAKAASSNPQRRYGEDIISRISYANENKHGLLTLNHRIIDALNHLVNRCLDQIGADPSEIDEAVIAGNTTMQRIIVGFHPRGLGFTPYLPILRRALDVKARDLGLNFNPGTNVYLMPAISGFVGSDAVSAGVAGAIDACEVTCLLVDIGTNGEILLGHNKKLWATSCATGPALEGAQISCGMRAVSGAIYKVDIAPGSRVPRCSVIGEEHDIAPVGLCGSGIIDTIASLRRLNILRPNGRFNEEMPGVILDTKGIGRKYILVPAEQSGTGKEISLTLEDVRQFQLAKAALFVGIEMLMFKAGATLVERTVLTGSFGAKFNWQNAVDIAMVPSAAFSGEVVSLENLAGTGAVMALLDRKQRKKATEFAAKACVVDLATDPGFTTQFSRATLFPEIL